MKRDVTSNFANVYREFNSARDGATPFQEILGSTRAPERIKRRCFALKEVKHKDSDKEWLFKKEKKRRKGMEDVTRMPIFPR